MPRSYFVRGQKAVTHPAVVVEEDGRWVLRVALFLRYPLRPTSLVMTVGDVRELLTEATDKLSSEGFRPSWWHHWYDGGERRGFMAWVELRESARMAPCGANP